jgi:hypothetical protein
MEGLTILLRTLFYVILPVLVRNKYSNKSNAEGKPFYQSKQSYISKAKIVMASTAERTNNVLSNFKVKTFLISNPYISNELCFNLKCFFFVP